MPRTAQEEMILKLLNLTSEPIETTSFYLNALSRLAPSISFLIEP